MGELCIRTNLHIRVHFHDPALIVYLSRNVRVDEAFVWICFGLGFLSEISHRQFIHHPDIHSFQNNRKLCVCVCVCGGLGFDIHSVCAGLEPDGWGPCSATQPLKQCKVHCSGSPGSASGHVDVLCEGDAEVRAVMSELAGGPDPYGLCVCEHQRSSPPHLSCTIWTFTGFQLDLDSCSVASLSSLSMVRACEWVVCVAWCVCVHIQHGPSMMPNVQFWRGFLLCYVIIWFVCKLRVSCSVNNAMSPTVAAHQYHCVSAWGCRKSDNVI